jgi:polysaccharide pyruvyl transferase WcaK-like protein
MRILIEGAGMVNKGAEAMLKTVVSQFNSRISGASFFVEIKNVHPGLEHLFNDYDIEILNLETKSWEKIIKDIDLTVDISGFRYSKTLGPYGAKRTSPIFEVSKKYNKPYIFLPQAFGPFDGDDLLKKICYESFAGAKLLYARDTESQRYIAKLLDKNVNEIKLAPDIAFCFHKENSNFASNYLNNYGICVNKQPIICISPNLRVYERSSGVGIKNTYLQMLSKICSYYIEKGVFILFVPHEIKPGSSSNTIDDRKLCEILHLSLEKKESALPMVEQLSAEKIKSIISCSDLLIGSRFHAIIAALHHHIPTVVLGWSHKYVHLMKDVELDQFVLNYQELKEEEVYQVIDLAWTQKELNKKKLQEKIPIIEKLSSFTFDEVLKVI